MSERPPARNKRGSVAAAGTPPVGATPAPRAGAAPLGPGTAILAWTVALALVALTAALLARAFSAEEVAVPELVGLPYATAAPLVTDRGLAVARYDVATDDAEAGAIVEQSPPAGAVVRAGRRVAVGVAAREAAQAMPSLVGTALPQALETLDALGLPGPATTFRYADAGTGRVLAQAPASGAPVHADTAVTLEVARGPEAFPLELPAVTGLPLDAARARLADAGFRRVEALGVAVGGVRPGTVTRQRPAAGTVQPPGAVVTVGYAVESRDVARVPDVRGRDLAAARRALRRAGLVPGPVLRVDRPDAARGVLATRPSTFTVPGAPVTLVVNASGADPEGATADRIAAILDADADAAPVAWDLPRASDAPSDAPSGAGSGATSGAASDAAPGATPAPPTDAGEAAEATPERDFLDDLTLDGAAVRGAPPAADGGRVVPFAFDPGRLGVASLTRNDYALRLVVRDADGERTALEGIVPAGEAVFADVRVAGDALLQTYVNDIFFQAWAP